MSETISKASVCEILADIYPTDGEKVVAVKEVDKAYEAIQQLPSAQTERPKGYWTPTYSDCGDDVWVVWKCSECGYVRKKGWDHTNDGEKPDALFCEMCGVDMRGKNSGKTT